MIHYYDNPNICYAIGDAVSVFIGAAAGSRQPASGVEEQISAIVKTGGNDSPTVYDGSNENAIIASGDKTSPDRADSTAWRGNAENMSIMTTNSTYIRKGGSSDVVYFGGVQTNA